jgi:hypothetical protein
MEESNALVPVVGLAAAADIVPAIFSMFPHVPSKFVHYPSSNFYLIS